MKRTGRIIKGGIFVLTWSLCGALILLSLPGWMDQLVVRPHLPWLVVFAILTTLCAPLGFVLLLNLTLPSCRNLSKASIFKWVLLSFVAGALLVYLVPLTFPTYPSSHRLDIRLAGQNDLPTGTKKLFIEGIDQVKNNFQRIDLTGFSLTGKWEKQPHFIDGTFEPLSTSSSAALLSWQGETSSVIAVTLRAGPESGPVEITWDGQIQRLDLYSEIGRDYPLYFSMESPLPKWLETILLLVTGGIGFGFVILTTMTWLVFRQDPQVNRVATRHWEWIFYAIPCLLSGCIYLLTFWPGVMTIDSLVQWAQVLTGRFSDAHPVFHTFSMWLVTRIWLSPAAVAMVQILAFSVTVAWGFSLLRKMGLPNKTVWVLAIVFAIFPPNGLMMVTLTKDVPYSICILWLTMMMLNFLLIDRSWIKKWSNLIFLACVSSLVALFRHNGVIVTFGALFFLWLTARSNRRYLAFVMLISMIIWFGVKEIFNLFLQPTTGISIEAPLLHPVAAHLTAGTPLSVGEISFLNNLQPVDDYIPYLCNSSERTDWNLPITSYQETGNPLVVQPGRLSGILVSLSLRNPLVTLAHYICKSSSEWQINNSGNFETFGVYSIVGGKIAWVDEHAADVGIIGASKLPGLVNFLTVILYAPYLLISSAIYRPAIYLWGLLAGIGTAILRSKAREYFLLAVPILLNSISLVFASQIGAFRYSYPTLLVSLMLTVALLFYTRRKNV